jgi:aerobic-type carbon monoxide dehydrogenase small subunit (CoxS/CutS family)
MLTSITTACNAVLHAGVCFTAKALLDKNPKPTEEDIRDALTGNLCICGTYPAHIAAVLEASGQAVA